MTSTLNAVRRDARHVSRTGKAPPRDRNTLIDRRESSDPCPPFPCSKLTKHQAAGLSQHDILYAIDELIALGKAHLAQHGRAKDQNDAAFNDDLTIIVGILRNYSTQLASVAHP